MKQKEKELFKSLCSFKEETFDECLLDSATPVVLGHLFFNRMAPIAYGVLNRHGLLGQINREFRNSLKGAYNQNVEKNKSFFTCIQQVSEQLSKCECKYAMLKGAYLCDVYPRGYRTSNDIDLLVHPKDVTKIGKALTDAGFKQGNVRNGEFRPATRKEIIESKMMRGETVPYIKEVNLPGMKFLEIDINFSLDYKPGDTTLIEEMLESTVVLEMKGFKLRTLNTEDFFIHLCCHLYKEATTLPWIEMMRDMTLYKYCDIYMLLDEVDKYQVDAIFSRAKKFGVQKICSFAITQVSELFNFKNFYAIEVAKEILKGEDDFIHIVVSPRENKKLIFKEKSILKRFFTDNRKILLKEMNYNDDFEYENK